MGAQQLLEIYSPESRIPSPFTRIRLLAQRRGKPVLRATFQAAGVVWTDVNISVTLDRPV